MLMKKLIWMAICASMLLVPAVFGQGVFWPGHQKCSVATLNGGFGVLEQGTVVGQLPGLPAPPFPMAIVALDNYDGWGNVSGSYTASFGGVTVSGTLTGTYTVNSDCTYSDQISLTPSGATLHRQGSILGALPQWPWWMIGNLASQEISFIYVGSGPYASDSLFVASGTAKRTPPGGCSVRQIKGNWAGVGQTTYTVSMWGFTAPFVANIWTLATADGAGNISGSGSVNLMGLLLPLEFTNVYAVTRDCGYSDVVYNDYGGAHSTGVIFGVEPNLEVVTVGTDPAQVSVTTRRRM